MGFYNWYERVTMASLRKQAKVPGFRKLGRWQLSKYEKNFWRSAWTVAIISYIIKLVQVEYLKTKRK